MLFKCIFQNQYCSSLVNYIHHLLADHCESVATLLYCGIGFPSIGTESIKIMAALLLMFVVTAFIILSVSHLALSFRANREVTGALDLLEKKYGNNPPIQYTLPEVPALVPNPSMGPFRKLLDVVTEWNPDVVDPPLSYREHLQHFNFGIKEELEIALKYREAEVPFKLYNVSEVNYVSAKWSDDFLLEAFKLQTSTHVESSVNNHFMFWKGRGDKNWTPPTTVLKGKTFADWLSFAKKADLERKNDTEQEHVYFMASCPKADAGRTFISYDLKSFSSTEPNFFISKPRENKGIQCRFGMRGVIAESHFDGGRNMVALFRGQKRYILTPPYTCSKLGIITDKSHPSYRHSVIDWSDPVQAKMSFGDVDAIETIMRQGEVLYIPSYWFHYMQSLGLSIQCNSRFGTPPGMQGSSDIQKCLEQHE